MAIPQRNGNTANIGTGTRTFFVTSSTYNRKRLFQVEKYAQLLCDVIKTYATSRKFELHAFVIMPDHFHILVSIGPETSIERTVQLIKGGFSYRLSHELDRRGEVWQRGFSEIRIYDDEAFASRKKYIHDNPVRARLVEAAEDYPYSSAAKAGVLLDASGTTKVVP
jgi:putative transposase